MVEGYLRQSALAHLGLDGRARAARGDAGVALGIDRFGASAPGGENLERFGFTADNLIETVRALRG